MEISYLEYGVKLMQYNFWGLFSESDIPPLKRRNPLQTSRTRLGGKFSRTRLPNKNDNNNDNNNRQPRPPHSTVPTGVEDIFKEPRLKQQQQQQQQQQILKSPRNNNKIPKRMNMDYEPKTK